MYFNNFINIVVTIVGLVLTVNVISNIWQGWPYESTQSQPIRSQGHCSGVAFKISILGLALTSGWTSRFLYRFYEARTDVFIAEYFQTQRASFSGRCGGRLAVGRSNGTRKYTPASAHEWQNNRLRLPLQANPHIMDQDFKIFDRVILLIEMEKRRLRHTVTKTAKKDCG